jgi:hypothetical protein
MIAVRRKTSEKGNSMMEFGLAMTLAIPLVFGTVAFGVNLGNLLQGTQIIRDVDHMYAQGVDFSQSVNQNIAVTLVQGLGGMTVNGGNGVIILSQIIQIYPADCSASGYTTAQCSNLGHTVYLNRIVIGNSALRPSNYGTPNAAYITAGGNLGSPNYLTKADAQASNFTNVLSPNLTPIGGATPYLADGQVAYVVEGYFASPWLSFLGHWDTDSTAGVYSVAIF